MKYTWCVAVVLCASWLIGGSQAAAAETASGEAIDLLDSSAPEDTAADPADGAEEAHPIYQLRPMPYDDGEALSISLEELLELAVANNLGLGQQEITIEKGHYSVDQTYYSFDPTVSGSFSYSYRAAEPGSVGNADSENLVAGIDYTAPREYGDAFRLGFDLVRTAPDSIFDDIGADATYNSAYALSYSRPLARGAGRYVNRIPRFIASNNLMLSYDRLDDQVRQLKKSVMDAYFLAVAAREAITVREASLEVSLQQLERTVERYKVGLAIRAELLQAENSVLSQRSQLLDAHVNYDSLLDSLTVLIGLPQAYGLTVDANGALLDLGTELPDDLWQLVEQNSYELKSLCAQLANLRLQRDQQLNQLRPAVDLSVSLGRSSAGDNIGEAMTDNDSTVYGMSLDWSRTPGERSSRASLAQADLDLASLDLAIQDVELQLKTALRQQQRDLSTKYQQIELAEGNLEVVIETHAIQVERNAVGLATTLDVVEAQEDVLSAELALLNARVSYQQAYREILLLAGLI